LDLPICEWVLPVQSVFTVRAPRKAWFFVIAIIGFVLAIPLGIFMWSALYYGEITIAHWLALGLSLLVAALVASVAVLPMARLRIVVNSTRVYLSATPLFRKEVRRSDVVSIAVINLREQSSLRPVWRLFGVSSPGFDLGWYRLKNVAKAFLALSSSSDRVVVVRLRDGSYLIVSPEDFEGFQRVLRSHGWSV